MLLFAVVAAWAVIGATALAGWLDGGVVAPHHGSHAPVGHGGVGDEAAGSATAGLWLWALMVVAMMMPFVLPQARWLAVRSLRRRRGRTLAAFTAGYLVVWCAVGVAAQVALAPVAGSGWVVPLLLVVAAGWHRSGWRRTALARCGGLRAPAIRGWRAVGDCARSGVETGGRCVLTCGAVMLPMAVAHDLMLMVPLFLVTAHERRPGPNPELRAGGAAGAVALLGLAAAVAVAGSLA